MGQYAEAEWYVVESKKLIDKHGDVPPPWIYGPNYHPYSIGWRMGGGESHVMILSEWLDQEKLDFDERLAYLRKYPCPPRWYQWVIDFLWSVETYAFEQHEFIPYFEQLEKLGFKNTADFTSDFNRDDLD